MTRIALLLAAALAVAGCASDSNSTTSPDAGRTPLVSATTADGQLSVTLLADRPLETGLMPLDVQVLTSTGAAVADADVTFEPMMTMSGSTSHGCPVGKPVAAGAGLYHGTVVFNMGSSAMGSWSAKVGVTRPGHARVEALFPTLTVSDHGRVQRFVDFDAETSTTTRYVASIRFPSRQIVGQNAVQVTLHRMAGMMSFPAVDDATLHVSSWMESMGHGGAGDVDPVLATSGVYEGKLGFQMAGDWKTTVTFRRPASAGGTRPLGTAVFDTSF